MTDWDVSVSVIEDDVVLVEIQYPCRHGVILDIMQRLSCIHLETYFVKSSMDNKIFIIIVYKAKVCLLEFFYTLEILHSS